MGYSAAQGPATDFRQEIVDVIDLTIERMVEAKFKEDPVLGSKISYAASLAGSTQKRHGLILEKAILFGLKRYESEDYSVWEDPTFKISAVADNMVNPAPNPYELLGSDIPYGQEHRTLQIDLIVYDRTRRHISAYEIKRGNSVHDAGKKRSILRDFVCLNLLIKGYGESLGLEVDTTSCNIIFYYGGLSIPRPHAISKEDLDDHFGREVIGFVEEANDYFREQVHGLIS